MAKSKFNLLDTMSKASLQEMGTTEKPKVTDAITLISVEDLVPAKENFYNMSGLEELKENIQLAGKVLQNLLVVSLGGGKYKILSGHRRCAASLALVAEGKPEFQQVPCSIMDTAQDPETQELQEEITLITSNSQREKTGWEKVEEARRIRNIIEKIREKEGLGGSTRNRVAEMLNTSPTQVARYDAIYKNLTPAFMTAFREEKINLSTAYELSGLTIEEQFLTHQVFEKTGNITLKEAKEAKSTKGNKAPSPSTAEKPSCENCGDTYYRKVQAMNKAGAGLEELYVEYRPEFCPQCGKAVRRNES